MFYKLFKQIRFILIIFFTIFTQFMYYKITKNYKKTIYNLTSILSKKNILYVKVFQAIAMNNNLIDETINNELIKFTDNVPYTNEDIDYETLFKLQQKYDIKFSSLKPINSGMISLVFKGVKDNENIVVKIKRRNINLILEESIDNLLFFIYCTSFISSIDKYDLSSIIRKNICFVKSQTNFYEEIKNMELTKKDCENLKYIQIPDSYPDVTDEFPNVIIMEYIQGLTINNIDPKDNEIFAIKLIQFILTTSVMHSHVHGDLHNGNILFIKDDDIYKIGILDFGIVYNINDKFKEMVFDIIIEIFTTEPSVIAKKILQSGLIEPLELINKLPEEHLQNIIKILTDVIGDMQKTKNADQIKIYECILQLKNYANNNKLLELGLHPSDDFVKIQLIISMCHGVIMTLCKDNFVDLFNTTLNELFHTKELISES